MGEYACPNGHPFPEVFDVGCAECEARVACEPVAKGMTLRQLLAELVDPDPCSYDHHGYCQAHSLHEHPCPHARAKEVLA